MAKTIVVNELYEKMNKGAISLIDVRDTSEFKKAFIKGSINLPLDVVCLHPEQFSDEDVYIMCQSGTRSQIACDSLEKSGIKNVVNVEGGIKEWVNNQLPVTGTIKTTIPMMRQVMIVAGLMILTGVGLHFLVHPKGIFLSAFVGAGLCYAGASGNCYMTKLLAILPWNK